MRGRTRVARTALLSREEAVVFVRSFQAILKLHLFNLHTLLAI